MSYMYYISSYIKNKKSFRDLILKILYKLIYNLYIINKIWYKISNMITYYMI